jgi:hypothetical protein
VTLIRILLLMLLALPIPAQETPTPVEPDYKFLFLIDNSFSMRSKKDAVVKTVQDLISTGFHNQAEQGDRFGIWLYNEKISKQFPSQVWNDGEGDLLARLAMQYLDGQKFEGKTDLLPALLELNRYSAKDRDMIVFLFCEGDEGVAGTPFDTEINRIFTDYRLILQRSRKPFLLTFAYHRGLMTDARVFYGAGVVELPQLVRRPLAPPARELVQAELPSVREQPKETAVPPEITSSKESPIETKPAEVAQPEPATPIAKEVKVAETEPAKPAPVVVPPPKIEEPPAPKVAEAPAQAQATVPAVTEPPKVSPPVPPSEAAKLPAPPVNTAERSSPIPTLKSPESAQPHEPLPESSPVGVITPLEPKVNPWPWVIAGIALLALLGYWSWKRRSSRPTSSLISQSIQK